MNDSRLTGYARLAVACGVGLTRGRRLIIRGAPVELPEIVEAIAEEAYRCGSPLVNTLWSSDALAKIRMRNAPPDSFSEYPVWQAKGLLEAARQGDAFVTILSSDPQLLADEDPARVSQLVQAGSRNNEEFQNLRMSFRMPWTVIAVPSAGWARRVYPELEAERAVDRLWEDLFAFCRVDGGDAVAAWRAHIEEIEARKRTMTGKQYRELRFEGPGTDLVVGLPDRHRWNGGQVVSPEGVAFSPNIPTEEIFTMPHRDRVHGTVAATRPLHFGGMTVSDLSLSIEGGVIVEARAATGQEQIERIIATDEGSRRLGEVALVSHDTPIARTGRTYFNGLIDENAASHLAIGRAYRDCVEEGAELSDEEFRAAGGNTSVIHIDFMVGSSELDVYGVASDGTVETVLRSGLWRL